jgi:hypothetical protein
MQLIMDGGQWKGKIQLLLPREVMTFLALALVADSSGKVRTGMGDLSRDTGLCKITLRRAIAKLGHLDVVKVESQERGPGAELRLTMLKKWITFEE